MKVKIKTTIEDVRVMTIFLFSYINSYNTSTYNESIVIHLINIKKLRDKFLIHSENNSHKKLKSKCSLAVEINQLKSLFWALNTAKQLSPVDIIDAKDKYLSIVSINWHNQYQNILENIYTNNIL